MTMYLIGGVRAIKKSRDQTTHMVAFFSKSFVDRSRAPIFNRYLNLSISQVIKVFNF